MRLLAPSYIWSCFHSFCRYYSFNMGSIHVAIMSTEHDFRYQHMPTLSRFISIRWFVCSCRHPEQAARNGSGYKLTSPLSTGALHLGCWLWAIVLCTSTGYSFRILKSIRSHAAHSALGTALSTATSTSPRSSVPPSNRCFFSTKVQYATAFVHCVIVTF